MCGDGRNEWLKESGKGGDENIIYREGSEGNLEMEGMYVWGKENEGYKELYQRNETKSFELILFSILFSGPFSSSLLQDSFT